MTGLFCLSDSLVLCFLVSLRPPSSGPKHALQYATMSIGIIDYGMANLRSVQKAFEAVGVRADIISTPAEIAAADKVVLPGVASCEDEVRRRRERKCGPLILKHIDSGKPFLGICLGLQMLFDVGYED